MVVLWIVITLAVIAGSFYAGARYGRTAVAFEQELAGKAQQAAAGIRGAALQAGQSVKKAL